MDEIDERRLKEPFNLQREQCGILLEGIEKLCNDFKYYKNELECNVLDEELGERIEKLAKRIAEKDVNLKNTLTCIQSSLGEMKDEFDSFQVDEDQEIFCPNYEIQLKDQIQVMNESEISKQEIESHRNYDNIKDLLNELQDGGPAGDDGDEDFAEIATETQLDRIPIDPVTQAEINIPVRNKNCRHVYDKDGITSYINQRQQQRKSVKCPTIGCRAPLTFNSLIEDRELKEKIDRLRHHDS